MVYASYRILPVDHSRLALLARRSGRTSYSKVLPVTGAQQQGAPVTALDVGNPRGPGTATILHTPPEQYPLHTALGVLASPVENAIRICII